MMFDNSKEKIREEREFFNHSTGAFRMATVIGVFVGRPYVTFYGETEKSAKKYKFLSSYSPAVGDNVVMARISGTYVILGKVV